MCAQVAALKEAYRDARSEAEAAAGELAALRAAHMDLQRSKDHSAEQVGCLTLTLHPEIIYPGLV